MFPLADTRDIGGFAPITALLVTANVLIFILYEIFNPTADQFIVQYALTPANVNWSDFSTLLPFITSQFLHGGWLHLLGNMAFLWVFGDNIEHRFGVFYLPFYLAAGVAGGLAQYFLDPSSMIPSLGASGAIAGILGAYLLLFPRNVIKTLVLFYGFISTVEIPATAMLLYWFVIQLFSGVGSIAAHATSADVGGVAYFAHIGGFGFGWLAAHLISRGTTDGGSVSLT